MENRFPDGVGTRPLEPNLNLSSSIAAIFVFIMDSFGLSEVAFRTLRGQVAVLKWDFTF
jgi:hypothetical protein